MIRNDDASLRPGTSEFFFFPCRLYCLHFKFVKISISKETWQTKSAWPVNFPDLSRNGLLAFFIGRGFFSQSLGLSL